jgi:hypothetical protein
VRVTINIEGADEPRTDLEPAMTDQTGVEGLAVVDDASAAAMARRTGAINAGRAPSGPNASLESLPASVTSDVQPSGPNSTSGTESAGSAPMDQG